MTLAVTPGKLPKAGARPFVVGTTGWSADDLDDPRIERLWYQGRYEIVEGVLTRVPPAYYDGALPVGRLARTIERYLDREGIGGDFAPEVDFIVNRKRVARVDLIFMTPKTSTARQRQTSNAANQSFGLDGFWCHPRSWSSPAPATKNTIGRQNAGGMPTRREELLDSRSVPAPIRVPHACRRRVQNRSGGP